MLLHYFRRYFLKSGFYVLEEAAGKGVECLEGPVF